MPKDLARPPLISLMTSCLLHGGLVLAFALPPPKLSPPQAIPVSLFVRPPAPSAAIPAARPRVSRSSMIAPKPHVAAVLRSAPLRAAASREATASMPPPESNAELVASASEVVTVAPLPQGEAVPEVDPQEEARAYGLALTELIQRRLEYPLLARKFRWEGCCKIRCSLTRAGEIEQVGIISPSEHELLDGAALRAIKRIGAFPPVPETLRGAIVAIEVPITFRLQD